MVQKIKQILDLGMQAIDSAIDIASLLDVKNQYLAKKSELMGIFSVIKDLSIEEKKVVGNAINEAKNILTEALELKLNQLQNKEISLQLSKEKIDITLPGYHMGSGSRNPFFVIEDLIADTFVSMGYALKEGPEIELDHYNFELLNIPKDHPAREMQDSLYINDNLLMRTHTSPVQAREMEAAKGQPIKIICPGKVYRRDEDDVTHSHQFGQIEGLVVDTDIHLGHLKQTLQVFAKKIFGEKREIRLRPSFFPFTEPSVEIDVSCFECGGKGCNLCKQSGWIEILGGGMVHPKVLMMNGYDPSIYSGFAFGIGIERVAMLKFGIDDIRRFYQNDLKFIKQFGAE